MEENIRIEISETNRGKKQIIINRKYKFKFNFLNEKKDNPNVHRYIEYRTSNKLKHKIKETIRKSPFSLDIRPKRIFNEISQDMGLICPEFNFIKTQIIRSQNKQLPPDITTFEEIPEEYICRWYVLYCAKIWLSIFYTTSISILKDKKQSTYETLFKEMKKKIQVNLVTVLTNEIKALIECYKNKEEKLICIGCDDDDIVKLWYNCLIHSNNTK
ncbi:hypothetical protein H8356DRAFT_1361879 [Neocallimastix lanati (nom. inval.)]|nr:hypothetical protein H8356DRAFT_1361879 [Neocallimastix sp. JGI-2020a]